MEIIYRKVGELTPYENNPRINDEAVDYVAKSIEEFGFKNPIIIDHDNVIVAGHTRLLACKQLGIEDVPCIMADDLTDGQVKAFRLVDNKTSEFAEWDYDLLTDELASIADIDMSEHGFGGQMRELEEELEDVNPYTTKIDIPIYEPTGDKPMLPELVETDKHDELVREIKLSNLPSDLKEFLMIAACRHYKFNYKNIAEYYAHSNAEVQRLMEKSALVIIDYNQAIEEGYLRISKVLEELVEDELDD